MFYSVPSTFFIENRSQMRENNVFHYRNVAVVRISGSPEAPPKAQKAHFDAVLSHFEHFQALWKLKNEPQEPSEKSAQKGSK